MCGGEPSRQRKQQKPKKKKKKSVWGRRVLRVLCKVVQSEMKPDRQRGPAHLWLCRPLPGMKWGAIGGFGAEERPDLTDVLKGHSRYCGKQNGYIWVGGSDGRCRVEVNMRMFYMYRWYSVPRESTTERRDWRTESWGTPMFGGQGHEQEPANIQTGSRQSKEGHKERVLPRSQGKSVSRREWAHLADVAERSHSN